jgi:hypothetical protein
MREGQRSTLYADVGVDAQAMAVSDMNATLGRPGEGKSQWLEMANPV